jgi:hypothetical protein
MLTTPTHLRDSLLDLDNDVGGLPGRRVALLGFRDPNAKRVSDNVQALGATSGWTVVDLRDPLAGRTPVGLVQALEAPKLVLLVDLAIGVPTDASLLIRALHDSHDSVRWADGTVSKLPAKRMLYVVAVGARSVEELPTLLQRIDFMTFVRPKM